MMTSARAELTTHLDKSLQSESFEVHEKYLTFSFITFLKGYDRFITYVNAFAFLDFFIVL